MPAVRINAIDIFYDQFGDAGAPVILLVMGLGMQMIAWPETFCGTLADRGFRVVRFDNRDVGLSTKIHGGKRLDLSSAFIRYFLGLRIDAPYSLDDMRNDTVGLMDALEIEKAHVVGASMGGMIAQLVASRNGERVKSLVSIMSSSGDPRLPTGKPKAVATLTASRPPKDDRESCVRFEMSIRRAIESPGYPASETHLRAEVERTYDRNNYRAGMARQLMAVLSSGSRVELLRTIRVPALVLHGVDDPLVPVEAGEDTARHIPGAVLKTFPGWGHDMPAALIPVLADEIAGHCRAAEIA